MIIRVMDIAREFKPRVPEEEYEITDVNKAYLVIRNFQVSILIVERLG